MSRFNEQESAFIAHMSGAPVEAGEVHWLMCNVIPLTVAYVSLGLLHWEAAAGGPSWAGHIGSFIFGGAQLLTLVSIFVLAAILTGEPIKRFVVLATQFLRHGHSWLGYMARWAIVSALPVLLVLVQGEMWTLLTMYGVVYVLGSVVTYYCFKSGYTSLPLILDFADAVGEELKQLQQR